jgi:tRNA A-37 threonylcarbamoyl transferase component Bud32/predicted nucleotidyltransferase
VSYEDFKMATSIKLTQQLKESLNKLKSVCIELCKNYEIKGACFYGSRICGYAKENSDYNILLILKNYEEGLRCDYKFIDSINASILIVDDELFELDVKKGVLGEFIAGRILTPYLPFINEMYLYEMEVNLKKRIVEEEIEELILEYGELSRGLIIKPEYFIISRLKKRAKVYPPLRYSYTNLFREDLREENLSLMKRGFLEALKLLENQIVNLNGENVTIAQNYIDKVLSRKIVKKVVNIAKFSQRAIYSYLIQGRAGRISLELMAKELTSKLIKGLTISTSKFLLEDPKNYLYLKTEVGLINLNESSSIIDALKDFFPNTPITVKPLGGVLNEVYLITAGQKKFVAKKYSDWFGFKWFTLNLVALGTKVFSLSGKARLANEYGITQLLLTHNIPIQKIIFVNLSKKLLVKEYVEGIVFSELIKTFLKKDNLSEEEAQASIKLGEALGKIHSLNIAIGDTKPENILLTNKGEVIPLDLEQSKKGGDLAWDIAELLYYSGHYCLNVTIGLKKFVENFIKGYVKFGNLINLKKAGGLNYTKVFSFWTSAPVIWMISSILKKQLNTLEK